MRRKIPKDRLARLIRLGWSYARIADHLGASLNGVKCAAVREGLTHFDDPDFIPLSVLASELGITRASLYERVRADDIPHVRHARLIGFTRAQARAVHVMFAGVGEVNPGWLPTREAAARVGLTPNHFPEKARRAGVRSMRVRTRVRSVQLVWEPDDVMCFARMRRVSL